MSNPVQTFVHERFGKVRVVMINGEPHFVAADVCRVLDIKNPTMAMKQLNDNERAKFNLGLPYGEVNVVNEPGLYRLIFASRKPEARDFQDWVYHEVLPSIRKTGSYSLFDKPAAEPLAAKRKPAEIRPELIYRVYVFLLEDNNSKLGRTKRLCIRIGEVKHDTRLPISKIYFTPLMSFENARLVERSCKEVLSSKRVKGEIFSADFDDVRATVEYFVQLVSVKPIDTDLNIATVNLKSAEKSE